MTPEEKAKELVESLYPFTIYADMTLDGKRRAYEKAKQCALIAVDEIIGAILSIIGSQKQFWREGEKEQYDYYVQVKQAIEKM